MLVARLTTASSTVVVVSLATVIIRLPGMIVVVVATISLGVVLGIGRRIVGHEKDR